jgi:hypothetical protein
MAPNGNVRVRLRRGDWEIEVEGPQEYVDAQIKNAEEAYTAALAPVRLSVPAGAESEAPNPQGLPRRLKEFVDQKGPKGHLEIIATLAYWAKEHGIAEVGPTELERLYKEAELKRPSDPRNAMAQAASKKPWLENIGGGKYRLTSPGEDFVNYDLPYKNKK